MSSENLFEKDTDAIYTEAIEQSSENPIVDYGNYEAVCNIHNDGSRRRGILSEEAYSEIIEDPNTSFINSSSYRVPVLMGVEHGLAMGYDTARCKEYAKELSSDVKILTLPIHELTDDEKNQLADILSASTNKYALYFSDHDGDESVALGELLDRIDIKHAEKPLVDTRAAKGDEQAALILYSCRAEQTEDRGERKKISLSDVKDYYEKNIGPFNTPDGKTVTYLEIGDRITDQQAEEMWQIYNNKFDFLGEGHPISMQDSKEDFFGLLRRKSTLLAATYVKEENVDEKLICFTYFNDDVNSLYWLNQDFLSKEFTSNDNSDYATNMFTPGIVSAGVGRSYAALPIKVFAKVADEAGISANVLYENTNLSKKYIPRIVDGAMSSACKYTKVRPSKKVDEVSYRLWAIGGENE